MVPDYGRVLVGMQVPPLRNGEIQRVFEKPWLRIDEVRTWRTNFLG